MDSGQIVAKYTQQKHAQDKGAMTTKDIVAKYTAQNRQKRPLFCASFHPAHFATAAVDDDDDDDGSSAFVPSTLNKLTLWHFECSDFPVHMPYRNPCPFCMILDEFGTLFNDSVDESKDRWNSFLQKGKSFEVDKRSLLLDELGHFLPSKMAKDIFFNRKLGVAVFRDGITPINENAQNCGGAFFRMRIFSTSGQKSAAFLSKIDQLLLESVRLIFDAPPTIVCHVNGLFIRWQIDAYAEEREEETKLGKEKEEVTKLGKEKEEVTKLGKEKEEVAEETEEETKLGKEKEEVAEETEEETKLGKEKEEVTKLGKEKEEVAEETEEETKLGKEKEEVAEETEEETKLEKEEETKLGKDKQQEEDNAGRKRERGPYGNLRDLPIVGKLEVWITDRKYMRMVRGHLIDGINRVINQLGIPYESYRDFYFINRLHNGSYRDLATILGPQKTCRLKNLNAVTSKWD